VNRTRADHIVSLEDPIEFVHEPRRCLVTQREIGTDTGGFAPALKHVLRQDPDVVLVGEMRDRETIEAALTVAETGHLVLSTLHTSSAVQTITRIVDVFPARQQAQIRAQLALTLQAVVAQQLVRRRDGAGRCLAVEVLIVTPAVRTLLRDEKLHQLPSQMQLGHAGTGMQTMSRALVTLVAEGHITADEAVQRATEPDDVRRLLGSSGRAGAA
jgi:twitching motility protein PilT